MPEQPPMQEQDPSRLHQIKIWAGRIAAIGAVSIASAFTYAQARPAHTELGPHNAQVQPTVVPELSIDLGPVGSFNWPRPEPIGVTIPVKEIPDDGSVPGGSHSFGQEDINRYIQMVSDIDQNSDNIRAALIRQGLTGAAIGDLITVAGFFVLGKRRRQELADMLHPNVRLALAATLITASVLGYNNLATAKPSEAAVNVSPIFKDTPLEGATIRGKILIELVNTYGPKAIEYYRADKAFYDKAAQQLDTTFENSQDLLLPDEQTKTAVFVSDIHCNLGMEKVIGQVQELYRVSLIFQGGDLPLSGSSLEQRCVDTFNKYLGRKKVAAVRGNHGSELTEAQQRRRGIKVLNGKVIQLEGMTILGDGDPMRSEFGSPIHQIGPESNTQMGKRLGILSCKGPKNVDIIMVHEPDAARAAAKDGCAKLVLSGHTHQFSLKQMINTNGETIPWLTAGTAGGAKHDTATIGPLKEPAVMSIISFDKVTHEPIAYQNITVDTNANVEISAVTYFEPN